MLSTAGSVLGGLLGGRRSRGGLLGSVLGTAGTAAGRRGRSRASEERVDAAENKVAGLHADLEDLEAELAEELTEIDARWMALAKDITTTSVALERTDVKVTDARSGVATRVLNISASASGIGIGRASR